MQTLDYFGLGDVLAQLRGAGCCNATGSRLHQLVRDGRLPRPAKRSDGRLAYDPAFVEAARLILVDLPSNRTAKQSVA